MSWRIFREDIRILNEEEMKSMVRKSKKVLLKMFYLRDAAYFFKWFTCKKR